MSSTCIRKWKGYPLDLKNLSVEDQLYVPVKSPGFAGGTFLILSRNNTISKYFPCIFYSALANSRMNMHLFSYRQQGI